MDIQRLKDDLIAVKVIKKPFWKISGIGWLCYRHTKNGTWNSFSQPHDPYFQGKVVGMASDLNYQYIEGWEHDLNQTLIIELNSGFNFYDKVELFYP